MSFVLLQIEIRRLMFLMLDCNGAALVLLLVICGEVAYDLIFLAILL